MTDGRGFDIGRVVPGCYVDGSWGQYAFDRLVDLADDFGLDVTFAEAMARLVYGSDTDATYTDDAGDTYGVEDAWQIVGSELYDSVTDMLPTDPGRPMYVWYWRDGELFYGLPDFDDIDDMASWYRDTVAPMFDAAEDARRDVIATLTDAGWTQDEVGRVVGLSQQRISQMARESAGMYPPGFSGGSLSDTSM